MSWKSTYKLQTELKRREFHQQMGHFYRKHAHQRHFNTAQKKNTEQWTTFRNCALPLTSVLELMLKKRINKHKSTISLQWWKPQRAAKLKTCNVKLFEFWNWKSREKWEINGEKRRRSVIYFIPCLSTIWFERWFYERRETVASQHGLFL